MEDDAKEIEIINELKMKVDELYEMHKNFVETYNKEKEVKENVQNEEFSY